MHDDIARDMCQSTDLSLCLICNPGGKHNPLSSCLFLRIRACDIPVRDLCLEKEGIDMRIEGVSTVVDLIISSWPSQRERCS